MTAPTLKARLNDDNVRTVPPGKRQIQRFFVPVIRERF